MARKKTSTIKIKRGFSLMGVLLIILALLLLVVTIPVVSEWLAKLFKVEPEKVRDFAGNAFMITVGTTVTAVGAYMSATPVGWALVLLGAAILLYTGWKLLFAKRPVLTDNSSEL